MRDQIFIQIASYRDPELVPTLRDCIDKAERPDLLTFGIAWQHDGSETLAEFANDARFRLFICHWRESLGACWARHQLQKLYEGEPYTLALDSHHRFTRGWDSALRAEFAALPSDRPVLTGYLPAYTPPNRLGPRQRWVFKAVEFNAAGDLLFVPFADHGRFFPPSRPVRARFLSAHFTFAAGAFLSDCGHDPKLYFHGEEITLSARAFTHGYDLFHPARPVIHHQYNRPGAPKHWDDHGDVNDRMINAVLLDSLSKWRVRQLLGMEEVTQDFGRFGVGTRRSLSEYERYAGVKFAERWISEAASKGLEPS